MTQKNEREWVSRLGWVFLFCFLASAPCFICSAMGFCCCFVPGFFCQGGKTKVLGQVEKIVWSDDQKQGFFFRNNMGHICTQHYCVVSGYTAV